MVKKWFSQRLALPQVGKLKNVWPAEMMKRNMTI